jgi:DNA polymerase III sliding clamp (beta) subunit (PCNA family)
MFKIQGEQLQLVVISMVKGARKARAGEAPVFMSGDKKGKVTFYFSGPDLQVEKTVSANVEKEFSIATTMLELEIKVKALPSEEDIDVAIEGKQLYLRWGRNNEISCDTLPETAPLIEIPELMDSVKWKPGLLHQISRSVPPFCAAPNSQDPHLAGVNFSKDEDTGECFVRATNRVRAVTINARAGEWFEGVNLTIPTATIVGLGEALSAEGEVTIGINEQRSLIVFECGSTKAVSRVLSGTFPPIDSIYTKDSDATSEWTFDRMELIEVSRRVKKLSPSKPTMHFYQDGAKVMMELVGVLKQQVGAMVEGEESISFAVHAEYMEVAAQMYRTDEIKILFSHERSPLTIRCEETEDVKTLIAQVQK